MLSLKAELKSDYGLIKLNLFSLVRFLAQVNEGSKRMILTFSSKKSQK